MTRAAWFRVALGAIALAILLLAFWGWRQGGLSLFESIMSYC
ncbi:MAG: hypothetical protein WC284_03455 [Candidimonas sp.]|jgi:HAMP domain-containing protein